MDETLAPLGWVLGVGSRTAAGEVSPDDASPAAHLDAPLLAALRPAAPLLVSRQIVVQLLSQVEKSRPTLVWATRALVGEQRAGSAMVTELLEGRSLRNLPPFLEALVRRSGDSGGWGG